MKNFRIGKVMGIPIYVNVTLLLFLPVLAWLISRPEQIAAYADAVTALSGQEIDADALRSGDTPLVLGAAGAIGLMAGVLIHELGHAWAARRYDVPITSITLWIFGGMAHMERLPEDWNVEFWVALAGPVTSVLLSIVFFGALAATPESAPLLVFVVGWLAVVNLTLAVFNMIPAFPMDGGRILRALMARNQPYATATRRAAGLAKVLAVAGAIAAVFVGAPLLILVSMFVYVAASSESRATVLRELLRGFTARDLMDGDVRTVDPDTSVADLIETVVAERRTAFPVVEAGSIRGVVTLGHLQRIETGARESIRVGDVLDGEPTVVAPESDAFELVLLMGENRASHAVVADGGSVVGLVSQKDIAEAIEVIEGVGPRDEPLVNPDGYA